MSKKMLEYSKKILTKVSFDIKLFKKELSKAYQYLLEEEAAELILWVKSNFGEQYYAQPIYIKNN
jgi:hypothetical protein